MHRRIFPSFRFVILLVLVAATFVANTNFYSLNFAITCMVNATYLEESNCISNNSYANVSTTSPSRLPSKSCDNSESLTTRFYGGTYLWNHNIQAALLAGESMGAVCFVFGAGMMLDRFGARWLYTSAFGIMVLSGVLTPLGASESWICVLVLRCFAGLGLELSYPAVYYVSVRWFPVDEIGTVAALAKSGSSLSGIFTMLTSGALCESALGWQAIFYMVAIITLIMGLIWAILFRDNIADFRFICHDEMMYILRNRSHQYDEDFARTVKTNIPLKKIFTSRAVWALIIVNFSSYYAFYFIGGYSPTYMKEILKLTPQTAGYMTSLQYVAILVGRNLSGYLSDRLASRTPAGSVRLFSVVSGVLPGVLWLIVPTFDSSRQSIAIACLVLSYFFFGFNVGGFVRSTCLLAPQFTGTISGISTTASYIAGILAPYLTGAIVPDRTIAQWHAAFYTTGTVCIVGTIYYIIFGSAEIQPWAVSATIQLDRNCVTSPSLTNGDAGNRRLSDVVLVNFRRIHSKITSQDLQLDEKVHGDIKISVISGPGPGFQKVCMNNPAFLSEVPKIEE